MPLPVIRMAPYPRRWMGRSPPSWNVPLDFALAWVWVAVVMVCWMRLMGVAIVNGWFQWVHDCMGREAGFSTAPLTMML
jgi:hypothetical protein